MKKKSRSKKKSSNIKIAGTSVDKILSAANFKLLGGASLGLTVGRFLRNKMRSWNFGKEDFKMILGGIAEIVGAIYISASAKDEFWQGVAAGLGASGFGTILTASGVPGLGQIWHGNFSNGVGKIKRTVKAKLGNVKPLAILPSVKQANADVKASGKVVQMKTRRRKRAV